MKQEGQVRTNSSAQKLLMLVVPVVLVVVVCCLDTRSLLISFTQWLEKNIDEQPVLAPVVYATFSTAWIAFCLPTTVIEMLPGFLWGFKKGVVISLIGKYSGNTLSVFVGRYVASDFFRRAVFERFKPMARLERVIEKGGFKMIVLLRAVFIPMFIKNYGLAVMNVPFHHVILGGACSGVPLCMMWTYFGSVAKGLKEILEGDHAGMGDLLPRNHGATAFFALSGLGFMMWLKSYLNGVFQAVMNEEEELSKKQNKTDSKSKNDGAKPPSLKKGAQRRASSPASPMRSSKKI